MGIKNIQTRPRRSRKKPHEKSRPTGSARSPCCAGKNAESVLSQQQMKTRPQGKIMKTRPSSLTRRFTGITWLAACLSLGMGSAFATNATYNTAGTTAWICPDGVTSVTVECRGGGGAGGAAIRGAGSGQAAGGGGGGGAYARKTSIPVTPGSSYSIVIPAAAENF
jgi:hypothetical protein